MSNPYGESQLFEILKTLVETVQQENKQLREERLLARALRERLGAQLLPHLPALLPAILTQLFKSSTCDSHVAAPGASHADAQRTARAASPGAAPAAPHTSVETPAAGMPTKRHWFYPSSAIGCGLNIEDLSAEELTCLRPEVTCSGCLAQLRADQESNPTGAKAEAKAQGPSSSTPNPPSTRWTEGSLSDEQHRVLAQFQEACRVIGDHDNCARWQLLGCAIEAELAALASNVTPAPWCREELEKYLDRSDTGRGATKIAEALHTLLRWELQATKSGKGERRS